MTIVTELFAKDAYHQIMNVADLTKNLTSLPKAAKSAATAVIPQPLKALATVVSTGVDIVELSTGKSGGEAMSSRLKNFAIKNGNFARAGNWNSHPRTITSSADNATGPALRTADSYSRQPSFFEAKVGSPTIRGLDFKGIEQKIVNRYIEIFEKQNSRICLWYAETIFNDLSDMKDDGKLGNLQPRIYGWEIPAKAKTGGAYEWRDHFGFPS